MAILNYLYLRNLMSNINYLPNIIMTNFINNNNHGSITTDKSRLIDQSLKDHRQDDLIFDRDMVQCDKNTASKMMRLPAELRLEILKHLVVLPEGGLIQLEHGQCKESKGLRHDPGACKWKATISCALQLGILRTCRQLYDEASFLFYSLNVFTTNMEAKDSSRDEALAQKNSKCPAVPKGVGCLEQKIGAEVPVRKLAFDTKNLASADVVWFLKYIIRKGPTPWQNLVSIELRNTRCLKPAYTCQIKQVPHTESKGHHCLGRRIAHNRMETDRQLRTRSKQLGSQLEQEGLCVRLELRTERKNECDGGSMVIVVSC